MFKQYAKHYECFNQRKPYKSEIEFIYDWAGKPNCILDLGCGTANYWKYFPTQTRLTGIERSSEMKSHSAYKNLILKGDICRYDYNLFEPFDCVTALFDVVNYLPDLSWIDKLPLKKGKFFIFDILEPKKERFKKTVREVGELKRTITPGRREGNKIPLEVLLEVGDEKYQETHDLYLWSEKDIELAATAFRISEIKQTETWQTWIKLRKK